MAARMNQRAVRRPPLPLTERDLADLDRLRNPGPGRAALSRLAAGELPEGDITEAVLLHAVFEAGLRAVREAAEGAGYEQLAAEYEAEDAERRAIARRRRPPYADED